MFFPLVPVGSCLMGSMGLYLQWTDPPVVTSGVVEGEGVEVEGHRGVAIGASYRVERKCTGGGNRTSCKDVDILLRDYGLRTVRVRGADGQVTELRVSPPRSRAFQDEDERADRRLLLVRPGDFVTAVRDGDEIELEPDSPAELAAQRTTEGRVLTVGAPLLFLLFGGLFVFLWRHGSAGR